MQTVRVGLCREALKDCAGLPVIQGQYLSSCMNANTNPLFPSTKAIILMAPTTHRVQEEQTESSLQNAWQV